jgi:hypothetical protein
MAPAGMAGIINDALALYFEDPAFAHAFVARFCCGYRVATIDDALTIRCGARPDRHTATVRKTPWMMPASSTIVPDAAPSRTSHLTPADHANVRGGYRPAEARRWI